MEDAAIVHVARRRGESTTDAALPIGVFVAALSIGLLFARGRPWSYDGNIMFQVTQSMVNHHSLLVHNDPYGLNTPYSSYGIGMSLAMIPLYELARLVGGDSIAAAMDVNAFMFALTMVALAVLAKLAGLTRRQALMTATLVGGGTLLVSYTATDFSEPAVALAVALGLVCFEGARIGRPWAPPLAGAATGMALLFRTDSIILVAPILALGVWWLSGRRTRTLVEFAVTLLPALGLLAWYNEVRFGVPWRTGYPGQPFNHPFLSGVYGFLFSPGRGLFVFVPLTLVAVAGARWAWRRAPVITAAAGLLLVARVLFYASWWAWDGGVAWGPRFLLPALPCLAVGLMEIVRRFAWLRRSAQAVVVVIASVSIVMQVVAALVDVSASPTRARAAAPEPTTLQYLTAPRTEAVTDAGHFEWQSLPFIEEPRVLNDGGHFVSKTLVPRVNYPRVFALISLMLAGYALARGSEVKLSVRS